MPLRTILGEILRRELLWWRQKRQYDCEQSHSGEPVKYYFEDFFPLGAKNGVVTRYTRFFCGFWIMGAPVPTLRNSGVKICKIVFDGFPYHTFSLLFLSHVLPKILFWFRWLFIYHKYHIFRDSFVWEFNFADHPGCDSVDGGSSTFLNIDCPSLSPSRSRIKAWSREIRLVSRDKQHL